LQGAAIGMALGVAAGLFLNSKKGKQLREDAKERMADFYNYVTPKIKKIGQMTEREYKEFMKQAAMQYGKAKKLSGDMIQELADEAQHSWKQIAKHANHSGSSKKK